MQELDEAGDPSSILGTELVLRGMGEGDTSHKAPFLLDSKQTGPQPSLGLWATGESQLGDLRPS